jgi:hypothetical protein
MNPVTRYKPSTNFNPGCTDLMEMAERELSAFFNAVTELFGSEQVQLSAEDWLQELIKIDVLPTSAREWTLITAKVSTRLPRGVNASSPSSSLSAELINA